MSASSPALPAVPVARWKALTKWQAFTLHLVISLLVFATLVAAMWFFWFPGELFLLDGGWQGLKLVALVDLILGPLLTLVLYSPGKRGVMFDMCMIAAFQIGALVYGLYTTYDQRTVAVVFAEKSFTTVSNAAMNEANQTLIEKELQPRDIKSISRGRPTLLVSETPSPANAEEFSNYLEDLFNGYPEAHERSDKFQPIEMGYVHMRQHALSEEQLKASGWYSIVQQELSDNQLNAETLEFYKFKARFNSGLAVFDHNTMTIVDYITGEPETDANADTTAESSADS